MANITALSSLSSSQAQLLGTRTVAFKDESTGYVFSIDSDGDVVYAKTTDGGVSFGSAVTVFSSVAAVQLTIWADWWTSGDTGTVIHIWFIDDDSGDVLYRSLDTSSDTLGTQRTVSNEAAAQYNKISATKTRGGMLAVATSPVANAFWTSTNGGVSWSSRSSPWEAEEQLILLPANLADANDLWCFYWDWSANAITLKTFDDSANSWSESSTILSAVASDPNVSAQPQFAAAIRWSDGHAILVAHMWYDSTSDVLQVVDVANASSWTSKANVTSGADDTASVAIAIDQNTGDLYVAYAGHEDGSETIGSSVGIYYKKSTDGGASWGAQQAFSETNDDYRGLWVDHGSQQFLFAPVFFNDDLNRVETNANNAVAITPPPPATATAALYLWVPELSATGTHRQSGGSAFVLWAPSLAASGGLSHLGTGSLELWVPVLYAGAGYRIPGTSALSLWPPLLAGAGFNNADAEGAGWLALWVPVLGASGEQAVPGVVAAVLWMPVLGGAGAMAPEAVAGLALWMPAVSASGRQAFSGAAALTLWLPWLAGSGGQGILSAVSLGLWVPTVGAGGVLQPRATSGLVLWVPVLDADGVQDLPGGAAFTLWAPMLAGSGLQVQAGAGSLTLWMPALAAAARQSQVGGSALSIWVPDLNAVGTQRLVGSGAVVLWPPLLAAAALHGYVHGTGMFSAPFPVFAALGNVPVSASRGRLRVDVYTAAGTKLAAGPLTAILEASYSLGLDLIGEFSLTLPAVDRRAALLAQGQRLWLYREGEGLLFKGIVERLQTEVAADGANLLHVSGASVSRELVWANTLLGRNYSAATLSDAVTDLLAGTGWSAGDLAAPATTLEATFEGASRWSALLKVAELFGLHLREDPWSGTVDLDSFGDTAPFVLQNVGAVSPRLRENPGVVPVATVSVAEEGTELWNSVLVHGAGEGINRLTLQWSTRSSPYAIQSAVGPDGEPYWYLEDPASVASFGRRQTVIVDKDAIPLSNSSSGLEAAANALYDGAVTWLQRHRDPLVTYKAKPVGLTHIDPATGVPRFHVGDRVRLRYAGVVQDPDGSLRAWRSVDALLWLMAFSRTLHGDGSDDWDLTLANVDRHTEDGASKIARALEELRALQVSKRPYTYAGSYGPYRDSVDSSRGLVLPVNFKRNVYLLREAHLYVTRKKVKSNVSTVASGGGSSPTSSSGGSSTPTSSSEASHTHTVSGQTANGAGAHRHVMFARYGSSLQTSAAASPSISAYESAAGDPHYHGMSSHTHGVDRYEFRAVNASGTNKAAYLPNNPSSVYDEDLHTYSAAADHTHSISATTSAAGTSHSHTVSVPAHAHTVTIAEHVHGLTYGIYEGPSPGSITAVIVNGTDRTSALGGPWAGDISELDISAYLQDAGGEPLRQVNTVEVRGASLMDLIVEVKTLETATSIVPV